jgi:hypothetical protein
MDCARHFAVWLAPRPVPFSIVGIEPGKAGDAP